MFVLMFYLYTVSTTMSGMMVAAEFTTKERCEAAAAQASKAFKSALLTPYHVCVEK